MKKGEATGEQLLEKCKLEINNKIKNNILGVDASDIEPKDKKTDKTSCCQECKKAKDEKKNDSKASEKSASIDNSRNANRKSYEQISRNPTFDSRIDNKCEKCKKEVKCYIKESGNTKKGSQSKGKSKEDNGELFEKKYIDNQGTSRVAKLEDKGANICKTKKTLSVSEGLSEKAKTAGGSNKESKKEPQNSSFLTKMLRMLERIKPKTSACNTSSDSDEDEEDEEATAPTEKSTLFNRRGDKGAKSSFGSKNRGPTFPTTTNESNRARLDGRKEVYSSKRAGKKIWDKSAIEIDLDEIEQSHCYELGETPELSNNTKGSALRRISLIESRKEYYEKLARGEIPSSQSQNKNVKFPPKRLDENSPSSSLENYDPVVPHCKEKKQTVLENNEQLYPVYDGCSNQNTDNKGSFSYSKTRSLSIGNKTDSKEHRKLVLNDDKLLRKKKI